MAMPVQFVPFAALEMVLEVQVMEGRKVPTEENLQSWPIGVAKKRIMCQMPAPQKLLQLLWKMFWKRICCIMHMVAQLLFCCTVLWTHDT